MVNGRGYRFRQLKTLPAYGFYLRHADCITLESVRLRLVSPDARKDIVTEDCTSVRLPASAEVR